MGVHGAVTFFLAPDIKRLTVRDVRPRKRKAVAQAPERQLEQLQQQKPPQNEIGSPAVSTEGLEAVGPNASAKTPFADCSDYQAQGGCQTVLHQRYEGNRGDILRCKTCGRTYSSRRGNLNFKSRLSKEVMERLVQFYQQGESIRKVSKTLSLNRGTVRRYYRLLDEQTSERP